MQDCIRLNKAQKYLGVREIQMKQWDKIYEQYGRRYSSRQKDMPKIVEIFKQHNVKRILEIGCGAGENVVYLAKQGFVVYGLDISKEGIKLAKELLKQNDIHAILKTGNMCEKLPYKDNFFDAVISIRTIHHGRVGDIRKIIKNIERVLKSGGLIFITVRKRAPEKHRSKYKVIAPRTYVPLEWSERGVIHYLFNKELLRKEFENFKIHDIWIEYGKGKWDPYYCLLGELQEPRKIK